MLPLTNAQFLGAALVKATRRLRRVIYISGNYPYLTRQMSVPYDIIPLSTTRKGQLMPRLTCIVCDTNLSEEISFYDIPYTWDFVCAPCNIAEDNAQLVADFAEVR